MVKTIQDRGYVQQLDPERVEFYRTLLRQMLFLRRFEERAGEAYAQAKIGGFCHLYIGQEAVAAGALAMLPLFRTERFGSLLDMEQGSGFFRLQLWQGAWAMAKDHPWLGVGPDNFLYAYRSHYVLPTAWQELNLSHPHNILLDFWTRLGLVGVITGIWLFGTAFRQGWLGAVRTTGDRHALALGLLASLLSTVAHGLIDNSIFLVDLMLLFSLTLGLIARLPSDGPLIPGQIE